MSARHPDGSPAEPVGDAEAFLLRLHKGWAKNDPSRLRRLAAVTLHANGWTMEMIAKAMGWVARGHAARVVNSTQEEIRQWFAELNPEALASPREAAPVDDDSHAYQLNA